MRARSRNNRVRRSPRPTALIVEPALPIARLIGKMMLALGFDVLEVPGPDQALARVEENGGRLDLLITELALPGISGPTLAAFVTTRHPGLPVVYLCDEDVPVNFPIHAPAALLMKPFKRDQLETTINRLTRAV